MGIDLVNTDRLTSSLIPSVTHFVNTSFRSTSLIPNALHFVEHRHEVLDKREIRSIGAAEDTDSMTISGILFVMILEKQARLVRDFWTSIAGKETGVRNSCKT